MTTLTLAEAKAQLNLTTSVDDAELLGVIDAAEAAIAQRVGPLASTTVTTRVRGGGTMLSPPFTPIVSITSVTPVGGSALTVGDLTISIDGTQIEYTGGSAFGSRYYDVVYQSGRAITPKDLLMAVKLLVGHMWQTQRGPATVPGLGGYEGGLSTTLPGAAFTFPIRVEQLIAPYEQAWL